MHHVLQHLHSHLLALLSFTAVDRNWMMQLVWIGNIFHSEQYVVGEDWPSASLSPHAFHASIIRNNNSDHIFVSLCCAVWNLCQQRCTFQTAHTHTIHVNVYIFAYIPNPLLFAAHKLSMCLQLTDVLSV